MQIAIPFCGLTLPRSGGQTVAMSKTRQRLDQALVARGLAESRAQAQRLILAGAVRVAGAPACKPAQAVDAAAPIAVAVPARFVSRGGEKLEHALAAFGIEVRGLRCLDVGASTGGFTDCLLQRGAAQVVALDVGRGQLHWKLRQDPRVVVREGVNARHLQPGDAGNDPFDFAAADVAFISLTKVLPAVNTLLRAGASVVTLIKPQFEAGRREVGRGGVVRDDAVRARVADELRAWGEACLGWAWRGACDSPLRGPAGNLEILAWWRKPERA